MRNILKLIGRNLVTKLVDKLAKLIRRQLAATTVDKFGYGLLMNGDTSWRAR